MIFHGKHNGWCGRLFAAVSLVFWGASPQMTVAKDCGLLLGGTDFVDAANSDTLWISDFNTIKQNGPSGNTMSSAFSNADSAQMFGMDTAVYTITSNPHLLDSSFINVDQHMMVFKTNVANGDFSKILSYQISGVEKGSSYTIKFKIVNLLTDTSECAMANPWSAYNVTVGISPNQYGQSDEGSIESLTIDGNEVTGNSIDYGKPGTAAKEVVLTGTMQGTNTVLDFQIMGAYNMVSCGAFGIYDLEITGCYKPKAKASQGLEMCRGEQTLLTLTKDYGDVSYKWMKSTDGRTFTQVASSASLYDEVKEEEAWYYCSVGGVNSDTLDIKTIVCCVDEQGNAMSRMNVFYEDFGHFTDEHVYVDADGNESATPATYSPYRTDTRFSMPSSQTFDPNGGVNDGSYAVIVPTANGYCQGNSTASMCTWMNGVTSDHTSMITGGTNEACLFINVAIMKHDVIFSTQIDGLCDGKNLFFETYIANQSGADNEPEITLYIKDLSNNVIASDVQTAAKGAGWVRVHIDDLTLPTGTTSVILEIVSTGGVYSDFWEKGNDLSIDDIKFMVCSPPSVDVYSNINSFASDTTICADTKITMGSQVSDMLVSFYKGAPSFLYQQSADGETWKNISSITTNNSFEFNTADYPADTNYYRVVVASEAGLAPFLTNPSDADPDDKCRAYSISSAFKVIRAGQIDLDTDVADAVCGGTNVHIVGSRDNTLAKWNWQTADGSYVVATTSDADLKNLDVKITQDTTFIFTAYNEEGCYGSRTFEYTVKPTVELELETSKQCGVTLISATGSLAGTEFTWQYGTDDAVVGSDAEFEVEAGDEDQTLVVTAELEGYCASDTVKIEKVEVLKYPDKPELVDAASVTMQTSASSFDLATLLADISATDNKYEYSVGNNGNFTDVWSEDANLVSLSTAGTFDFWVRVVNEQGCTSDTVQLIVNIVDVPVPDVTDDYLCLGSGADFSLLVTPSDADYELIWYSADDETTVLTGAPAATTPAEVGPITYYVAQQKVVDGVTTISSRVPVTITILGVEIPALSTTDVTYCLNSTDVASVGDYATTYGPEINYYFTSGLQWYLNDNLTDQLATLELVPSTAVDGTNVYSVRQYYANPKTVNGGPCYSDFANVTVNVVSTEAPTSLTGFAISYLQEEAADDGYFDDVMTASSNQIAVAADDCELVWYDAAKNVLSAAPSPTYVPTATEDYSFSYYVAQKNTITGCESQTVAVTITVSMAPTPVVTPDYYYCEGTEDIPALTATKTLKPNDATDTEDNYELLWYKVNPNVDESAVSYASITPESVASKVASDSVYLYYVVQKALVEPYAASSPVEVRVHIYTNPVISTTDAAVCKNDNSTVDLSKYVTLLTKTAVATTTVYSDDAANVLTSSVVSEAGEYSVSVGFTIPQTSQVCPSSAGSINVTMDELSGLAILPASVCPGKSVTLSVDADALSTNASPVSYDWAGSNGDVLTGDQTGSFNSSALGNTGDSYSFTVVASAGLCSGVVASTVVSVGNGVTDGTMSFAEEDNAEVIAAQDVNTNLVYYSCGGEVTVTASVTSVDEDGNAVGDYVWTDLTTGQSLALYDGKTTLKVTPADGENKYRLSYTNICPTYIDFIINSIPVKVTEVAPAVTEVCEGQSFDAQIQISCSEFPSVEWTVDGAAKTQYRNSSAVSVTNASSADAGVYAYTVTNRGCSVASEYNGGTAFKVKPYVQIAATTDNYVARRDSVLALSVDVTPSTASVLWNGVDNGATWNYTVTADAVFNVVASATDYCSDSVSVSVVRDGRLSLSVSTKDSICAGNIDTLFIDTTGTGRLIYADKYSVVVTQTIGSNVTTRRFLGQPVIFAPTADATYSVTCTYREGEGVDEQSVSWTQDVKVLQNIRIEIPSDLAVCDGQEISVALTSVQPEGTVVSWQDDESITSSTYNTESITAAPTFDAVSGNYTSHKYYFNADYSICSTYSGYVSVRVYKSLDGVIDDVTICEGSTARIDASSYSATSYTWSGGDLEQDVSTPMLRVTPAESATYTLNMTRGECSATKKVSVYVNKAPVISYIDSLDYRSVRLVLDESTGTPGFSYSVDDDRNFVETELFENLQFGPHTAYVLDAAGCTGSLDFSIASPKIEPNILVTPNGDGVNDVWGIPGLGDVYPDAVISIYDRYGKLLVKMSGNESWDGTYNGNAMPSTDYWYEIRVGEIDKVYTGHFTLLRQ